MRRVLRALADVRGILADMRGDLASGRGFAWSAVVLGLGAVAYFSLPFEPDAVFLAAPAAALGGAALAVRATAGRVPGVLVATALFAAGVLAAKVEVDRSAGPVLDTTRTVTLTGRVLAVEDRGDRGGRLLIAAERIDPPPRTGLPHRMRIASRDGGDVAPGDRIRVTARVGPPQAALYPGGYDFARAAFFAGIGGVGFTLGAPVRLADPGEASPADAARIAVERFRAGFSDRVRAVLPGDAGAIAAALIVGDRGAISPEADEAMRVSGLSHVLSISGLHMALVAACLYGGLRAGLALVPVLALRLPIKAVAALTALLGTAAYLVIAGMSLATQRSAVMIAVALVAVLVGRRAVSMRGVAAAAIVVVAFSPEAVLDPGAQMSFAAVTALVAGYEVLAARERRAEGVDVSPVVRAATVAVRFVGLSLLTSILAGIATAPIAVHHFNRSAPLGLVANLLATPVVSFVIMPAGLVAAIAAPVGLEALPLKLMGAGIDAMVAIARAVASWTPDGGIVGRPPVAATLLIVAGGTWVCLWTRRARRPGWLLVALGIALSTTGEPPDLVVAGDGRRVLVRGADGYQLVGRPDDFETPIWLAAVGDPRRPDEPSLRDRTGCDREACILRRPPGEPAKTIERAPDQPTASVSCDPETCGRPPTRVQGTLGPLRGRATAGGPADGPGQCEIGTCADATIAAVAPIRPAGPAGRTDPVVAVIFRPEAFLDECSVADVVVASIPAPEWCRRVTTVIDVDDLADGGARTYRLDPRSSGAASVTLVETGRAIPAVRRPFHVGAP